MEINTKKIVQNASNKYLDAKIQTMDTSIFQFVQSFDQLIGNMKKILNNTSQTVRSKFYTNENENDFVQNSIQFNSTDEFVFLDGVINASIDRLREINYYDHNGDGINDLAIPGSSLLGNIKNFLNISGYVNLQVNASIEGPLSPEGTIYIYLVKNETSFPVDITQYYKNFFGNKISNSILAQYNRNNYSFPSGLNETIESYNPDRLEPYFLVKDQNANITIIKEPEKSRIEGCINGTIIGGYIGVIKARIDGLLNGTIDVRLKEMYGYMVSLLNPILQWVYFATPDYFFIFPWAPDFLSENSIALSASFDWLKRDWYNELWNAELNSNNKGNENHFSNLGVDYVYQNIFISLGQGIYNESTDLQGILVLDINLDYLMNTLELRLTSEDFTLIINDKKEILLSPEYIAKKTRKSKETFPTSNIEDYENPILQDCVSSVLNYEVGNRSLFLNDTEYIVFYRAIPSIPWFMLHFSPIDLVMEDFLPILQGLKSNMRALELVIGLIAFSIITVFGGIAILLNTQFTRMVTRLQKGIESVSEGDFSVSFDIDRRRQTNEIQEIYYTFEDMALKLDEAIRKEKEARHLAELAIDLFTHDLSNYHQAILGYLELVKMMEGDIKQITPLIENSIRVINKANEVKDKLRKISGIEPKAEPMVKQKLATYVDNAIATIQTSHPDRKIILHKEFDENLEIYSNIFLEDIFANVFNNSLQSTNKKEITFTVKAKHIVKDKDSFWEISVEDNGSGISNGMKRQIEESFKTGQRIRGLGMMFIYRIVKAFQGDIRIENRVVDDYTQGTRIVFTLKDYTI